MRSACLLAALLLAAMGQIAIAAAPPTRHVILDTDIGDDIDDAFALGLILDSPSLHLDAISTSLGDTALRARLVERFLHAAGRDDIPVYAGPATRPATRFTQADWVEAGTPRPNSYPDAVEGLLGLLRHAPDHSITLVALAPLTTIGVMIARDPSAFRRLAGVVMMGGSIIRGYGDTAGTTRPTPSAEYNVRVDPAGLRSLLASGVPVEMLPVDATEIALDRPSRDAILAQPTGIGRSLAGLYPLWAKNNPWGDTPVLFDVVPVARLLRPSVCTPTKLHLRVDESGRTVPTPGPVAGPANVSACLSVDRAAVLSLVQEHLGPDRREAGPGRVLRQP